MIGMNRRHSVLGIVDTTENATEEEVKRSLKHLTESVPGMWWERIYDVKDYMRKCPKCHAPISRCPICGSECGLGALPPKRRADFHMLIRGVYYLIECKSSTAKDGFITSFIKPHQHEALLNNIRAGGRSLLFIGNRHDAPTLYCISYGNYMNVAGSRAFVKWTDLATRSSVLQRLANHGEPYYDLTLLIKGV